MPKYDSIYTIPAKVFFEIIKTKNYQLLKPKPREKGLDAVFISIYDDFFVKSENPLAERFLELSNEIAFLTYKIEMIKASLHFIYSSPSVKELRTSQIKALNEGCGLNIDENGEFTTEALRILNENVGWIENDLEFAKAEYNNLVGVGKVKEVSYWERIIALSASAPPNLTIRDDMFLSEFLEVEKAIMRYNQEKKTK